MKSTRLLVLLALALSAGAQAKEKKMECEDLARLSLPHTKIELAQRVPAGPMVAPDGKTYEVPAFCRIHGLAKPTEKSHINFELWLPAQGWTGRYYQHGQGGSGGVISYATLAKELRSGNAAAATDDGHVKPADLGSSWALEGPEILIDFGYRALKETSDHARALIRAYYGKPQHHAYFGGCSDGGRLAFMAAQRFPEDWDGIIAGAPGNDRIGFSGGSTAWVGKLWLDNPEGRIPPGKLPAIQRAALASCTPDAHVVNGIAADPRFCPFDPSVMTCKGEETNECLTAPQVDTLRKIYAGPRSARTGESIYRGWPPTSEANGNWGYFITGGDWKPIWSAHRSDEPGWLSRARQFYQDFVYEDANWDFRQLDLDRDLAQAKNKQLAGERMESVLNAVDTDLSRLRSKGGKILMYFGWADDAITPLGGIDYYEQVARESGGWASTQDFFRLFLAPGMNHCVGGAGPNAFGQAAGAPALKDDAEHDVRRALEAWVERGVAPRKIVATKYFDDKPEQGVAATRPMCAYPQVARYKGTGSTNEARNFECVQGTTPPVEKPARKGYLVIEHEASGPEDREAMRRYAAVAQPLLAQYGGRFVVSVAGGARMEALQGGWAPESLSIIEFPTFEQARAFYFSKEYQSVLPIRLGTYEKGTKELLIEGR